MREMICTSLLVVGVVGSVAAAAFGVLWLVVACGWLAAAGWVGGDA
jgi:hypothetical protein